MEDRMMNNSARGKLAGKVAVVTGGSRGIGLGIAREIVRQGGRVCITGRKQPDLDAALAEFPEGSAIAVAGKAHDPEHRAAVLDCIAEWAGGLDILVTNAGINPVYGETIDITLEAAAKIFEVNVLAPLAWVQDTVRHERLSFRERRGNMIIVSSVTGQTPSPGIGFYGVSKAANAHLARTLGAELGPDIRVNAVAPAVVRTQFAAELYEGKEDEVIAQYPAGRLGTPDDIASAVAFLASDEASWISSQVVNLDGGLLANGGRA